MAPAGQRDAHTPQSIHAAGSIDGAPPFVRDIAPVGQTVGLRSAGKSGREVETTSSSRNVMHGASGHRRHVVGDEEPFEKFNVPGFPWAISKETGTSPAARVLRGDAAPMSREKIRGIRHPSHVREAI